MRDCIVVARPFAMGTLLILAYSQIDCTGGRSDDLTAPPTAGGASIQCNGARASEIEAAGGAGKVAQLQPLEVGGRGEQRASVKVDLDPTTTRGVVPPTGLCANPPPSHLLTPSPDPGIAMPTEESAPARASWVRQIDEHGVWLDALLAAATDEIHHAIEHDEVDDILEGLEGDDEVLEMLQEVQTSLLCPMVLST